MLDLFLQYKNLQSNIDKNISEVLNNTDFINGSFVKDFQVELSNYLNSKFVICCGNGTDALLLSLLSLNLKEGDKVITSDFSFIAAAEAIAFLKLKPVFVDVDKYFNIDSTKIESKITERTKAIIPVHLFGQCCNMEDIISIAKKYNLYIIEDNAQSFGSDYIFADGNTKKAGTIGDIGCTSFFPSKNLSCFGDGGAIFTNNEKLAERLQILANHGAKKKYHHEIIGMNSRLDTIQAAILIAKLPYLDSFIQKRREIATIYDDSFANCSNIKVPAKNNYSTQSYHQYTITVENIDRNELKQFLQKKGIATAIYYPEPLHKQIAFKGISPSSSETDFQNSNYFCKNVLSLPIYPELDIEKQKYICETVLSYCK